MATQDPHTLHQLTAFHFEDLLREATQARLAANSESNVASRRLLFRAERFFGRAQMIRVIALAAFGAALLVPAVVRAQTSDTDPVDVAQDGTVTMSNPQSLAAAYGDLSVFILNVAAGNDGVPRQPEAEQAFKEVFAQPVAAAYPSLSPDDQQGLAQLAALDGQIHQAWSSLPVDQRLAARDQWAAAVQDQVANAPCQLFDAMARAQLLPSFGPYKQPNLDRLVQCWNEHTELAKDSQGNALPALRQDGSGSHAAFVGFMNANTMNFAANMNIASNIGGGAYSYTVK